MREGGTANVLSTDANIETLQKYNGCWDTFLLLFAIQ